MCVAAIATPKQAAKSPGGLGHWQHLLPELSFSSEETSRALRSQEPVVGRQHSLMHSFVPHSFVKQTEVFYKPEALRESRSTRSYELSV